MNITYLTNYYTPEVTAGANRASEQIKVLIEYGHNVRVITGYPNYPQGKLLGKYDIKKNTRAYINGVEVIRCRHIISENRSMIMRVLQYLSFMLSTFIFLIVDRQLKPEKDESLLYVSSGPIFVGIVGFLISKIRSIKMVIEYRDITHIQLEAVKGKKTAVSKIIRIIELFIARHSYKTVVSTESFRQRLLAEGLPEEDIITVYNGVLKSEEDNLNEENETVQEIMSVIDDEKLVFMYIGTIGISQDLCTLIDEIGDLDRPKQLIIIGDGAQKELVASHADKVDYSVYLFPSVPKYGTDILYKASDLQVVKLKTHPLFGMFMPSKIFDIMKAGKMIYFSGPSGEVTELMDRHDIGFYNDNSNEILEYSNEEMIEIGKKNQKLVYELFDRRNQLQSFITVI